MASKNYTDEFRRRASIRSDLAVLADQARSELTQGKPRTPTILWDCCT